MSNDYFKISISRIYNLKEVFFMNKNKAVKMNKKADKEERVAYFCMEYGLHEDMRIYAGGLGILAGDLLKTAYDLDKPLIGIGILWRQGYTRQLINKDGQYSIKERCDGSFSQELSNIIHHHFEVLHGSIEDPSREHRLSSPIGKAAIALLNHLIHDMESLYRQTQTAGETFRAVLCEMPDSPRYVMPPEFYEHFTTDIDFGDLIGHYGMVGKTW
jgi:hypothetical protein